MKKWMIAPPYRKQFKMACLWVFVVLCVITTVKALISSDYDAHSIYLSVSLNSPGEGVAALYYDVGEGFNENHVVSVSIKGGGQLDNYLFKIPNKTIYSLRWDPPLLTHDVISIGKMEILDGSRRPIKRLSLSQLEPLHQIRIIGLSDVTADFQVLPGAHDPQIKIHLESPIALKGLSVSLLLFIGALILEFLGFFLGTCLMIYIWFRQRNKVIATVIVIFLVLFGWRCLMLYDDAESLFLQITMSSSIESNAQIFYDLGQGLNEKHSQRMHIPRQEEPRQYRFKLPNKMIYNIRFDPLMKTGKVRIREMKVTDSLGNLLREIPLGPLEAIHQIKSINARNDQVEIVVTENANDPQIGLPLKEALNFEGKLPFPVGQWLLAITKELILFILLAVVFSWGWKKKWGDLLLKGLESPFFQEKLPLIYLGSAFGLILAMAFISGFDTHPDEYGQIKAAAYYIQNWLPPAVDDPRIIDSISVFGVSYLWQIEPIYFIAVKASQALSFLVPDFYLRLRLANAFLFLLLVLIVATQINRSKWLVPFLVVSPQMWYVFSYFNSDGFPLVIAILLAMQFIDSESSLNRFLSAPILRQNAIGGVLAGILMGILITSKLNYLLYIVFLIFVGLWRVLFEVSPPVRIPHLKKWIFVGFVALLVYLPIYGYDQYVNDFKKTERAMVVMERHAGYQFKPSTLRNESSSTYPGLRLRDKGMSLEELLIKNPAWRDLSFKSFFGVYGYMDLVSDEDYYLVMTYMLGFFSLVVFFYMAFTLPVRDVIFVMFVLLFTGLAVGQSVYHSWVNDYQPQGRYLFPMLPMLMIGLAKLPASFRARAMPLSGLIFFILSVWSFLLTGLRVIPKIN